MKNLAICLLSVLMCISALTAQPSLLPKLTLLTCEGTKVSANTILSEGRPMLIVYWNLSSKECYKQVEELLNTRDESLQSYNVKIVGIFVDNLGDWQELRPIISGKSWDIEVYIDVNAQLQRAMCIPALPFTMLYDPKMSLVCSSIGYCANMGDKLCEKVKSCLSDTH
jgi:hypothetical protein